VTYTLYGSRGSGSAAIEIALRVSGLPYRQVRASSWESDSAIEELSRINPLCQIPTLLLPDGTVLTESAAILIHLGLVAPQSILLPRSASHKAQAIRGLVFIAANCYCAISINDYPQRWTTATTKSSQEKVRQGARRQLHKNWEIFSDIFLVTPYLSGNTPGALDFLAVVVSKWAGTRTHLSKNRPRFLKVLEKIQTHESVAPVFSEHWEDPVLRVEDI
jgi:GST-like protein